MSRVLAVVAIAVLLGGCAVASVAGAAVDATATAVSTTADVAGAAVHTVAGSSDDEKKN